MKKHIAVLIALFFLNFGFAQEGINKLDEKGQRHGVWKGTYDGSKRPRYEGTFEHGKETGVFKFFDDTKAGKVIATRDFTANDGSCYTIMFDQKGNKVSEGKEVNKLYEGEWKFYHKASPVIMSLENYSKGKLNGVTRVFYPTKVPSEEIGYVDGVKNGVYKKFTDDGVVLEETKYKDGKPHGPAVYRNPKGQVILKGQYERGLKVGIWTYYEKGKKVKEEDMTNKKIQVERVKRKS
ncbi:MAG: hypothetical protein EOO45_23510 [Flavobacterium sp.]|nr:MAG: hypothetical protein EOO45_23510 [Flavobacterium sp.]